MGNFYDGGVVTQRRQGDSPAMDGKNKTHISKGRLFGKEALVDLFAGESGVHQFLGRSDGGAGDE